MSPNSVTEETATPLQRPTKGTYKASSVPNQGMDHRLTEHERFQRQGCFRVTDLMDDLSGSFTILLSSHDCPILIAKWKSQFYSVHAQMTLLMGTNWTNSSSFNQTKVLPVRA